MRKALHTRFSRFDQRFAYDGELAHWWIRRSADSAHRHAYAKIADFIRASFRRSPRVIVDYACGAGNLLALLSRRFANSKLVGLDRSSLLLNLAQRRFSRLPPDCAHRITLIRTSLPDPSLLRGGADLVIFCFPNMVPSPEWEDEGKDLFPVSHADLRIAGKLALAEEPFGEDRSSHDPFTVQKMLEMGRCISKNLRNLLVPGGICVRVEYSASRRHEWSPLESQRIGFEEGTLEMRVDGLNPRRWFRVLASAYFRSGVMQDVYQQSGEKQDRRGGYQIAVLRAL